MKRLFLILIISLGSILVLSYKPYHKTIWVLDNEHVLTPGQVNSLDSLYKAHEKITTNEIALVTTPDLGSDTSIRSFAANLGRAYGVGKKGKDKGRWSVGIKFCWLLNEFCRVVAWDWATMDVNDKHFIP